MNIFVFMKSLHQQRSAILLLAICLLALLSPASLHAADPAYTLTFSTYFGGSEWEHARDVVADAQGNVYMAGGTFSKDFPTSPGAYDRTYNGGKCDGFIVKFSPAGRMLWSTLIGGPNYDRIYGVELDPQGNVVVAGRGGPGFPTTPGAFQPDFQGTENGPYGMQNGFVAKLSPDGTKVLWASYVGVGQLCRDVAVDADGDIYLPCGTTGAGPLPPAAWFANAFQKKPGGDLDTGAIKIAADGTRVIWATWLGGSAKETQEASIRVDRAKNVFLAFNTQSPNMPTTPGAHDATHNGGEDGFAVMLSPDGSRLIYGTYLGGSAAEWVLNTHNLAIDAQDNAYISIVTASPDFPTTPGAFSRARSGKNDMVIVKLSPTGALLHSTFVGGNGTDNPDGIYADDAGNVFCAGATESSDFPTTPDAFQKTFGGQTDAVAFVLAADFSRLLYSTYLGGKGVDNGRSACFGPGGELFVTGSTDATDWPVKNAHQPAFAGGPANFGAGDCILARFAPPAKK